MSRRAVVVGALFGVAILAAAACGDDSDVSAGDGSTSSSTSAADGPVLTVAEAVEVDDGADVTVEAYVFRPSEGATVLCDVFGESFPPTCVGPHLVTDGLDVDSLPGLETSGPDDPAPATWTAAPVRVSGTLTDGALVVSP